MLLVLLPPEDVAVLACEVVFDAFGDGLVLARAVLLLRGEPARARLADVVRLGLVEGAVDRAEGDAVRVGELDAVLDGTVGVNAALVAADDGVDGVSAVAALLGSSPSGPPRSTAPPATASDTPAAAAAVITLRPTCTDRE